MIPYLALDLETTGLDPDQCQILEVGAVFDDWTRPLESLPRFHCYVVHERIHGEPHALAMNHGTMRRIANRDDGWLYETEDGVAPRLREWIYAQGVPKDRYIGMCAKNGGFDWGFLKLLPSWSTVPLVFAGFDPGSIFYNPETDSWPPSLGECLKRAGLEGKPAHRALGDAIDVVRLMRKVFIQNAEQVAA